MSLLQNASAGTYFEEVNLSQEINPVTTAVGAIVGEFLRGEPNVPVLFTSTKNFVDETGSPSPELVTWPTTYCGFAFLRRSSQMYGVRVLNSDNSHSYAGALTRTTVGSNSETYSPRKKYSSTVPATPGPYTATIPTIAAELPLTLSSVQVITETTGELTVVASPAVPAAGEVQIDIATGILTFNAAQQAEDFDVYYRTANGTASPTPSTMEFSPLDQFYSYSIGPGSYGTNISYSINSDNAISPTPVPVASTTTGGTLTLLATYRVGIAAVTPLGEMAPEFANVTLAGTENTITVTFPKVANAISYKVYLGTAAPSPVVDPEFIATIVQPSGSADISYIIDGSLTPDGAYQLTSPTTDVFTINIFDSEISVTSPVESFEVSLNFKVDGFNQQLEIETKINAFSRKLRVVKNQDFATAVVYPVARTSLVDGIDGTSPTANDISLGWDLFADKEKITVRHLINGGVSVVSVQQKMNSICTRRGDCTAYLDVPTIYQKEQDVVVYRNEVLNLNTTYSALYTPDLQIQDEFNGRLIFVPPSGHAAGVGAASGLRAPAGLNRGILDDVQALRYEYNQEGRDLIASAKVNYVRNFPGRGIAIMEAFTLESQMSALSFLNVRYTLNLIKPTVENALDFSLFEPNDDITRRQISNLISEFLDIVRDERAIQDYLVVIDESNNPPIVTGNGQLNVDIYIIPTLPIQRIRVRLIVTKQGVSLAEVAASGV